MGEPVERVVFRKKVDPQMRPVLVRPRGYLGDGRVVIVREFRARP